MSPSVEEFLSTSSTHHQYFQNPNPSAQKHHTDSVMFNNSFGLMNSSKLDFDCSNDAATAAAAATVRSSRRKYTKVKKQSSCSGAGSTQSVNSTGNTTGFVFNASNSGSVLNSNLGQKERGVNSEQHRAGEFLDPNVMRFTMGATDNSKLEKYDGYSHTEEVQDNGNKFQPGDLNFVFGVGGKADTSKVSEMGFNKFGKLDGMDFVFGLKMNNGVMNSNSSNIRHDYRPGSEADSHLVNSLAGMNLGTSRSGDVKPLNNNPNREECNTADRRKVEFGDFVFSSNHGDKRTDLNYQKEELKEKVGTSGDSGTATEDMGKKGFNTSTTEIKSGDSVNRNVDNGIKFSNRKDNGVSHIGNQNEKRSSFKGSNIDSVRDNNYSFVFGSNLGNTLSDIPESKVSDDIKTTNIYGPSKVSTTNKINDSDGDSCSHYNNVFVFGSDKAANKTDVVNKMPACEETFKVNTETSVESDAGVPKGENQPINNNEKNSDGGQCYQDQLKNEAPDNFSFQSKFGGFGTSFTGFNTPDINLPTFFTSDMFPGLGKKLEFSNRNPVAQRKLRKTKKKLSGHSNLCKEAAQSFEESSGCSPMDVSPYGVNEDAVDNTETINVSSCSATSFASADMASTQRPHQKKYKLRTGRNSEFRTPKSRVNVSQTKASDQEICDKWRKRGNQAYKNGDLSEAEICYTKGISSIQHSVTAGVCIEPLLLCYSNRAAACMALGRLREGLQDCSMTAKLDPNFVKANLRSANCHLLLGELEDACYNYNKCLEFDIVLDRRIAIEAADGLRKAQKVSDHMKQSAELLQEKTYESATNALGIIANALSISCYSEKLLNMKGDALLMLGKHKEVVQLCEETLESAEKNFATDSLKLWRWKLMSKSYFHLGRLELALDLIEKHEQLRPTEDKIVDSEESLASLAVTIRQLLHCKKAGNEAFQSGKHTEAVAHYSAAISESMGSHSFAAVCFCNRAAAHQSLGEISDAIGDCSIAIALDATYQKALSRRATLWEMIRDYKHAADDLQRLISILEIGESSRKSPTPGKSGNGSVKDLRRARRRLSSVEEKAKNQRSLDLYLILGIKASDGAVEVKKAYRKAALKHHPDKAGQVFARAEGRSDGKLISESIQGDADILFKMIGEAYAVLSDSTKRSKYDVEEEMWDDMNINVGSCSTSSDFYTCPFERRYSQDSRKTYGNSSYYYWQDPRKSYNGSYSRW